MLECGSTTLISSICFQIHFYGDVYIKGNNSLLQVKHVKDRVKQNTCLVFEKPKQSKTQTDSLGQLVLTLAILTVGMNSGLLVVTPYQGFGSNATIDENRIHISEFCSNLKVENCIIGRSFCVCIYLQS